jgi:hypothetical protein
MVTRSTTEKMIWSMAAKMKFFTTIECLKEIDLIRADKNMIKAFV